MTTEEYIRDLERTLSDTREELVLTREALTRARFDLLRTAGAIKMAPDVAKKFAAEGMTAIDEALR